MAINIVSDQKSDKVKQKIVFSADEVQIKCKNIFLRKGRRWNESHYSYRQREAVFKLFF